MSISAAAASEAEAAPFSSSLPEKKHLAELEPLRPAQALPGSPESDLYRPVSQDDRRADFAGGFFFFFF